MASDPEHDLERTTEELDERLKTLEGHIDEAEEKSANATLGEGGGGSIAGDWEDTDDASGGEDPVGAPERDEDA